MTGVQSLVAQRRVEEWLTLYGDRVLRVCFVWLRDVQLAEDALQETFLKAWQAMPRYEQRRPDSDIAWLMRIAVNTCKDMRRGAWFKHIDRRLTPEDLPPALTAVEENDRTLFLTVMDMPRKYRDILLLYFYAGMTLRECGQALGVQASTAHRRLQQAQDHLKTQLEEGGVARAQPYSARY
ncbi:MAG TPA: sigma-70 family RNA polymerase sigma factor [Clostridiales bacterium]|nr:sigma-70 family RNA polymerase sigma factor [Clostridiales bacterium]